MRRSVIVIVPEYREGWLCWAGLYETGSAAGENRGGFYFNQGDTDSLNNTLLGLYELAERDGSEVSCILVGAASPEAERVARSLAD